MATGVTVIADGDGAACLVATVDGVQVTFATVNASQLAELQAAQDAEMAAAKASRSSAKDKETGGAAEGT